MANRFRDPLLRSQYDAMVAGYRMHHGNLFTPEGVPHMGAGVGMAFWHGYRGKLIGAGFIIRSERRTPNYACWRAGQDCRAAEGHHPLYV
jgi:hypothetical protein